MEPQQEIKLKSTECLTDTIEEARLEQCTNVSYARQVWDKQARNEPSPWLTCQLMPEVDFVRVTEVLGETRRAQAYTVPFVVTTARIR